MKKKIIVLVNVFLITLFACTVYYFSTTEAAKKNVDEKNLLHLIGDTDVSIIDTGNTNQEIKFGESTKRSLKVKNNNQAEQFIRIMLFPTYIDKNGVSQDLSNDIFDDINSNEWVDGQDGYLYYLKKLSKDQVSEPVFNQITIATKKLEGNFTLQVKVETSTAAGNLYRKAFWNRNDSPGNSALKKIDEAWSLESIK